MQKHLNSSCDKESDGTQVYNGFILKISACTNMLGFYKSDHIWSIHNTNVIAGSPDLQCQMFVMLLAGDSSTSDLELETICCVERDSICDTTWLLSWCDRGQYHDNDKWMLSIWSVTGLYHCHYHHQITSLLYQMTPCQPAQVIILINTQILVALYLTLVHTCSYTVLGGMLGGKITRKT